MKETNLHIRICHYIKHQYPNVLFTSESSGLRVSIQQAKLLKKLRSCAGLPDLWILEPRKNYYGMFLELKKEGTTIYKKNGDIRADKHLQEQEEILHQLQQKGYFANFSVGYDETKSIIDYYLGL
jgi:hypothetical protein|tara:strand:- start:40835 stop:41209 length:375 start_codon:yes stop_codon:yes gene_type:complete